MSRWIPWFVAVLAVCCGLDARATVFNVPVVLTGANERPTPVATEAYGTANVLFDDQTGQIGITGQFFALTTSAILAHLHGYAPLGSPGQSGTTAAPLFNLTFDMAQFGNFSGSSVIPQADIPQVLAGLSYINIHSGTYPLGEIRGQVVIPEPTSAILAALGLAGLTAAGRRRGV